LKGGKNSAYEGGIRVPAFIYAPNYLPQRKVDHRITVNDILPTLVSAAGITSLDVATLDGVNQWNFLKGDAQAPKSSYVAVSRFNQAYFKEEWKLFLPNEGAPALFKIGEDPREERDLADQYPEVVETLKSELLAFPRGVPVDDPLWKVFVDPDLFGGAIDRQPFAGQEGKVSGPLHQSFYLFGIVVLVLVGLIFWLIRLASRRIFKPAKSKISCGDTASI